MRSKKGQEITVNFLVKFILSIAIFGLGVVMLWSIFSDSKNTVDLIGESIEDRIPALNCNSKEDVCVGTNTLHMNPGDRVIIDVKMFNNHDYTMTVGGTVELLDESNSPSADVIANSRVKILPENIPYFTINPKSDGEFSVGLILDKRTPKGDYVVRLTINRQVSGSNLQKVKRINMFVE